MYPKFYYTGKRSEFRGDLFISATLKPWFWYGLQSFLIFLLSPFIIIKYDGDWTASGVILLNSENLETTNSTLILIISWLLLLLHITPFQQFIFRPCWCLLNYNLEASGESLFILVTPKTMDDRILDVFDYFYTTPLSHPKPKNAFKWLWILKVHLNDSKNYGFGINFGHF